MDLIGHDYGSISPVERMFGRLVTLTRMGTFDRD